MKRFTASPMYWAYIRSDGWLNSPTRRDELKASGGRCRLCDRGEPDGVRVHVHHRSYDRLGCELQADLTTLCVPCHELVTPHVRKVRRESRLARVRTAGARQRAPAGNGSRARGK